jgi:hypothetical protein
MIDSLNRSLVGRWRLLRWERLEADGETRLPFGDKPVGVVIYTDDGFMAVQIMKSEDGSNPSPNESQSVRASGRAYLAYCGRYEVNEAGTIVIHHVEASLNPNWVNNDQARNIEWIEDGLLLSTTEGSTLIKLYWRRDAPATR